MQPTSLLIDGLLMILQFYKYGLALADSEMEKPDRRSHWCEQKWNQSTAENKELAGCWRGDLDQ